MSSDLLEEFIFDSREHLSNASSQLLALEKNPSSLEDLNALMGTLHTIKGNSGFVNLRHLYELLHAAESLLQTVREAPDRKTPPNVVETLFQVLDTCEAIMVRLENDEDDDVDWLHNLMDALNEAAAALEWGVGEDPQGAQEVTAPASPSYGGQDGYLQAEALAEDSPSPEAQKAQSPKKEFAFDPKEPVQKIVLEDGELLENGEGFLEQSKEILGHNPIGLILDMRQMTSFTSPEVQILKSLGQFWGQKLTILLSEPEQSDFYRMFSVLDLLNTLAFFPGESEALAALKAKS
jgi:chemotaxis protein histidine kinase CheA